MLWREQASSSSGALSLSLFLFLSLARSLSLPPSPPPSHAMARTGFHVIWRSLSFFLSLFLSLSASLVLSLSLSLSPPPPSPLTCYGANRHPRHLAASIRCNTRAEETRLADGPRKQPAGIRYRGVGFCSYRRRRMCSAGHFFYFFLVINPLIRLGCVD